MPPFHREVERTEQNKERTGKEEEEEEGLCNDMKAKRGPPFHREGEKQEKKTRKAKEKKKKKKVYVVISK